MSTAYVHRLGRHHFAHLRCVAEGVSIVEAAKRYLGIEHGHQAHAAHLQTREAVRAVARRRGLSAWRLIGIAFDAVLPGLHGLFAACARSVDFPHSGATRNAWLGTVSRPIAYAQRAPGHHHRGLHVSPAPGLRPHHTQPLVAGEPENQFWRKRDK